MRPTPEGDRAEVSTPPSKRWLGVPWNGALDFGPLLHSQMAAARRAASRLGGLVDGGALPLPFAIGVFEAKVDSHLQHARWLHVMVPNAEEQLDSLFEEFARLLLRGAPWSNPHLISAELGWSLSGYARSVKAMALRRAPSAPSAM